MILIPGRMRPRDSRWGEAIHHIRDRQATLLRTESERPENLDVVKHATSNSIWGSQRELSRRLFSDRTAAVTQLRPPLVPLLSW
jgi:hypothetical protein